MTVKATAVVCTRLPEVPVIVTLEAPRVAASLALKISVLVLVAGFGLNAALTPAGRPDAARLTLPLNPLVGRTEIVLVVLAP